jgi:hypothetical protein
MPFKSETSPEPSPVSYIKAASIRFMRSSSSSSFVDSVRTQLDSSKSRRGVTFAEEGIPSTPPRRERQSPRKNLATDHEEFLHRLDARRVISNVARTEWKAAEDSSPPPPTSGDEDSPRRGVRAESDRGDTSSHGRGGGSESEGGASEFSDAEALTSRSTPPPEESSATRVARRFGKVRRSIYATRAFRLTGVGEGGKGGWGKSAQSVDVEDRNAALRRRRDARLNALVTSAAGGRVGQLEVYLSSELAEFLNTANDRGETALTAALRGGQWGSAALLLECDAIDVNAHDGAGESPCARSTLALTDAV